MFDIQRLPILLLSSVLHKMDCKTFCKLRQSGKKMDSFAEKNRANLSIRSDRLPLILFIKVDNEEEPKFHFHIVPANWQWLSFFYSVTWNRIPEEIALRDPFMQLSCIRLDTIFVHFDRTPKVGWTEGNRREMRSKQDRLFDEELLPLIRSLRLTTERLLVSDSSKAKELMENIKVRTTDRVKTPSTDILISQSVLEEYFKCPQDVKLFVFTCLPDWTLSDPIDTFAKKGGITQSIQFSTAICFYYDNETSAERLLEEGAVLSEREQKVIVAFLPQTVATNRIVGYFIPWGETRVI